MTMTPSDRATAARELAARLPSFEDRAAVASAAGFGDAQLTGAPTAVWRALMDEAASVGKASAVLRAAGRRRPDDPWFPRALAAAEAGRRLPDPRLWQRVALVVVVGLLVGAGARLGLGGAPSGPPAADDVVGDPGAAEQAAAVAGAATAGEAEAVEAGALEAQAVSSAGNAAEQADAAGTDGSADDRAAEASAAHTVAVDERAEPSDPDSPTPSAPAPPSEPDPRQTPQSGLPAATSSAPAPTPSAPAPSTAATPTQAAPSAATPTRAASSAATPTRAASSAAGACAGKSGWAYMGATTTLGAGDVWTVSGGVNVRAAPPSASNGWSSREPLQCVLPNGARVRLSAAPERIPGGAVWVALSGDDVMR